MRRRHVGLVDPDEAYADAAVEHYRLHVLPGVLDPVCRMCRDRPRRSWARMLFDPEAHPN